MADDVDLGGDQESRARAWASERERLRAEETQRQLRRYGPTPHTWKVPSEPTPPGVIPWAGMYIIIRP